MNKVEWQAYLQSQQAKFSDQDKLVVESFDSPRQSGKTQITPLLYQGIFSVIGPDSAKFLQGQITCDIHRITPDNSILGAVCTPQGRMLTSFRVFQAPEQSGYLLRMRHDLVDHTQEALHKYSVFFKTDLGNASDSWLGVGVWGDGCEQLVSQVFGVTLSPEETAQVTRSEAAIIIRVPGNTSRYECWVKSTDIATAWEALSEQAERASNYRWLQQEVEAGIGEVSLVTESDFNPHMLNFQLVDAISFDKGCYTGQEIVARTHYRGKSKRLMKRFSLSGGPLLATGTELHQPDSDKTLATVICSAPSENENNCQQALLVVSADQDTEQALTLCSGDSHYQATELPLPYSLE
jgi:hypothetical protein